jgi:hypothetical protein
MTVNVFHYDRLLLVQGTCTIIATVIIIIGYSDIEVIVGKCLFTNLYRLRASMRNFLSASPFIRVHFLYASTYTARYNVYMLELLSTVP